MKHKFFIKDDKAEIFHLKDFESVTNYVNTLTDSVFPETKLEVYNIATVSDKLINRRIYPDNHVLDTVLLNKWTKPFAKPLLTNHDIYSEALGRVRDNFYIKHSDCSVRGGSSSLPKEVVDKLKCENFLNDGTGSVVLKLDVSEHVLDKILKGQILTTSQASSTNSVTCSICGKDYGECDHIVGGVYDGKTAHLLTGELEPYEDSVVNAPANDSSILLVFNKDTKECFIYGTEPEINFECPEKENTHDESSKVAKDSNLDILNNEVDILKDSVEGADMEKYKKQLKKFKDRAAFEFQKALKLNDEKLPDAMKIFDEISDEFSVELLSLVELIADSVQNLHDTNIQLTNDNKALQDKLTILESAELLHDENNESDVAEENLEEIQKDNSEINEVDESSEEVEIEVNVENQEESEINVSLDENEEVEDKIADENTLENNVPDFLELEKKEIVDNNISKFDNKRKYRHNVLNVSSNFGR